MTGVNDCLAEEDGPKVTETTVKTLPQSLCLKKSEIFLQVCTDLIWTTAINMQRLLKTVQCRLHNSFQS